MAAPLDRLSPWLTHPRQAAILTDFDGTLAPIVADPAKAVPLPGVPAPNKEPSRHPANSGS